jgi:hypothetical protein
MADSKKDFISNNTEAPFQSPFDKLFGIFKN